ncbi:MAG: RNA 2',3'-cyclic phosphodiesterase [Nitrospirae bacterium]|nr:RNA 2',3'-cyclic phosphodiesterase [Nitrospirota bacterium]
MPSAIRAFIAVPLTPDTIERLKPPVEELRAVCRTAKIEASWSRPEGWHLTLKFLGPVAANQLPPLLDTLPACAARHAAFALQFNGFGAFPDARRPRVLWVGVEADEGARAIESLAREIDAMTAALGYPAEERPYAAHLTVGRIRVPRSSQELTSWLEGHGSDRGTGRLASFKVEQVALMRSDPGPGGSVYTPVAVFPLA